MHALPAIDSTHLFIRLIAVLVIVLVLLFTAIMPAFFFAVYRNEGILRVPKRLRLVSLAAALTSAVMLMVDLPGWIRSLGRYWTAMTTVDWRTGAESVLIFVRDPRTIGQLTTCLEICANIAYILLLIALFRQPSEHSETDLPVSRLLKRMAKMATIAWGVIVLAVLLGLLLAPYTFYTLRNYALQLGRTPPTFEYLLVKQIRIVLQQACLFAASYVVYKSLRQPTGNLVDAQSGLEPLEMGG